MWDTIPLGLRRSLADEVVGMVQDYFSNLEKGDFRTILDSAAARGLIGRGDRNPSLDATETLDGWRKTISQRLKVVHTSASNDEAGDKATSEAQLCRHALIGYTALLAFIQSNFTGPPLPFAAQDLLFDHVVLSQSEYVTAYRAAILKDLSVDGVAAYRLTPNVELLALAEVIFAEPTIAEWNPFTVWTRFRITFIHQKVLSEVSGTLQDRLSTYAEELKVSLIQSDLDNVQADLLLELAAVETYYGNDKAARRAIHDAAKQRQFAFALTGRLGKRTKFQEKDTSQLVVLAKSHGSVDREVTSAKSGIGSEGPAAVAPKKLDLNDDTLLEAISFKTDNSDPATIVQESALPSSLASLDPSEQPLLDPRDSVILLALASAITNTSPADGLTREETLPYATRVLEGGSSNWQVYTQALLVRSRIEGYKSRTIERGLLQLQALVDQVIVETTSGSVDVTDKAQATFLPQATEEQSAPVQDRLSYFFQLASPARWDLEAELAQRWVTLGGLRSALEIYERLEMWAEAALCWAATEREEKARRMVRKLLYHASGAQALSDDEENWEGPERNPLPSDAPRLFCILGDLDQDPKMYEKAWEVSGNHYARAQRSLARLYFAARDYLRAAAAYSRSLHVSRLDHATWFAFGCTLLELEEFTKAAEAFTRCIQLDERDAEAWSNLAAALLKKDSQGKSKEMFAAEINDGDEEAVMPVDPQRRRQDALRALKRAASLKHDSYQIWENVMIVAASLTPPDAVSVIAAQSRIIDIRGQNIGEKCVDVEIMGFLVRDAVSSGDYEASKPGTERMLCELVDRKVQPLITASVELWLLVAKLALWRKRPSSTLDAHEKAWRAVTTQPGWENSSETRWNQVVDATVELCDAYESFGPMESTEGLGAGQTLVAKDWKFKARSALRSIMGRGKDFWEDSEGWTRLKDAMDGLRG